MLNFKHKNIKNLIIVYIGQILSFCISMKQKIIDFVQSHSQGKHGCHDIDHTLRVTDLALLIGQKEGADLEVLEYASLLHDIGRPYEDASLGEICHATKGAEIANTFLPTLWLSQKKIDHIVHCILSHRSRNNITPDTLEAKILFDSDKLDSLWATGIWRAFMFAQEVWAKLHNDKDTDISTTKSYTKEDTAYREFAIKLHKIKDHMFTQAAKEIAQERHDFMVAFFKQLNKEIWWEI